MSDNGDVLLHEDNIISLRTALVIDDGRLVSFSLMPAWLQSSIPGMKSRPSSIECDHTYIYQHTGSNAWLGNAPKTSARWERWIKMLEFENPPKFTLLWTDSGNSVVLLLNAEPWAFIDERTQRGYSKGLNFVPIMFWPRPATVERPSRVGYQWEQGRFESLFGEI